jgi:hypothetical protein
MFNRLKEKPSNSTNSSAKDKKSNYEEKLDDALKGMHEIEAILDAGELTQEMVTRLDTFTTKYYDLVELIKEIRDKKPSAILVEKAKNTEIEALRIEKRIVFQLGIQYLQQNMPLIIVRQVYMEYCQHQSYHFCISPTYISRPGTTTAYVLSGELFTIHRHKGYYGGENHKPELISVATETPTEAKAAPAEPSVAEPQTQSLPAAQESDPEKYEPILPPGPGR